MSQKTFIYEVLKFLIHIICDSTWEKGDFVLI